jgi:hypothetical protein
MASPYLSILLSFSATHKIIALFLGLVPIAEYSGCSARPAATGNTDDLPNSALK